MYIHGRHCIQVYTRWFEEFSFTGFASMLLQHGAVHVQGGYGVRDVNLLIGILSETNFAKLSLKSCTKQAEELRKNYIKFKGSKISSSSPGPV